jgi:hypothetical protein
MKLSPFGNSQFVDENGAPAVGWKINTYAAGSSTAQATYTSEAGDTAQANPIVLDSLGKPSSPIWLTDGQSYKFVVTDANDVVKITIDNIDGVNDTTATTTQFNSFGVTPTYVSATSFTLPGDQTSEFHVGRRLKFTVTAGTVYGTIATTAYTTLTTVTMTMDSGEALDSGLSSVGLSILRADKSAVPLSSNVGYLRSTDGIVSGDVTFQGATSLQGGVTLGSIINEKKGSDIASAATVNLTTATGNLVDITGTTAITEITLAEGAERTVRFTGALTLTHGASLVLPGNKNITTVNGDFAVFRGYPAGVVRCVSYARANGKPVAFPDQLSTATGSAPSYSARAWVNFNGSGVVTPRADPNVSSITDNGVGDYTINFAVAMPDANYCAIGSCTDGSSAARTVTPFSYLAGSVRITTRDSASAAFDPTTVTVAVIR